MPTIVIENVPTPLFDRIQDLANSRHCSASDAARGVLEGVLLPLSATGDMPLPPEIQMTEEISAPCSIPWPKSEVVTAIEIQDYLPTPHDIDVPNAE